MRRKPLNQLLVDIGIQLEKKTNGAEICDDNGFITFRFSKIQFETSKKNKSV